jgi:tetratricopeptide (TPR) repeat protein
MVDFLRNILLTTLFFIGIAASAQDYSDIKQVRFNSAFIEANKHKMLGNHGEAMEHFFQALEINPDCSVCMFEIARFLYLQKDLNGAISLNQKAIEANSTIVEYKRLQVGMFIEAKMLKQAESLLRSLIAEDKYTIEYYIDLNSIYISKGSFRKSEKILQQAYSVFKEDEVLIDEFIQTYISFGKYQQAITKLESLIESNPYNPYYYRMLVVTYSTAKRFAEAVEVSNRLMDIDSDTTAVNLMKLDLYIEMNDYDGFIRQLTYVFSDNSIDLNLKLETLYKLLNEANTNYEIEQIDKLVLNLYSSNPENIYVRGLYAEYLFRNNMLEELKPHLYALLEADKSNLNVYEKLVYLEFSNQQWDSIVSVCKTGMDYFMTQPFFYFYSGIAHYNLGNYNKTINILLEGLHYLQDNDQRADFYFNIAEAYYKLDQKKLTYQFYEKVISADSKNAVALNNYSYYLAIDSISLDKALKMSVLSNELKPGEVSFIDTKAWIYYKMGNYGKALQYIEQAYNLGGDNNYEILDHYGDILYKLGRKEEAIKQWNNALLLDDSQINIKDKIEKGGL